MSRWEKFEDECFHYLCEEYGAYAEFRHEGRSDSTVPDIYAMPYHGGNLYIEVKENPAQCGQFVLIPDMQSHTFAYSPRNKKGLNVHSKRIINRMNENFSDYAHAGTAGKAVDLGPDSQDVFWNWVIDKYANQGVRLVMTDGFIIFPLERFKDYFDIKAVYRVKKSGSRDVPKGRIKLVEDCIFREFGRLNFNVGEGNLFVSSETDLDGKRFKAGEDEYMFSRRGRQYEVRKLSNTYNANVIFSLALKKEHPKGLDRKGVIAYFEK